MATLQVTLATRQRKATASTALRSFEIAHRRILNSDSLDIITHSMIKRRFTQACVLNIREGVYEVFH